MNDPRMGVLDRAALCPTDDADKTNSPGYFGHIELARPMFHYGFMKNTLLVLRCVCFQCSMLKCHSGDVRFRRAQKMFKGARRLKAYTISLVRKEHAI